MLVNQLVKLFLSRLNAGAYVRENSTIAFYPTIDMRKATVTTKTSGYTVTLADLALPTIFNNAGAGGDVPFTLPSAALARYKVFAAFALAAQTITVTPITGDIINYGGSVVASKYARVAGVIGNSIILYSDGTQWIVTKGSGVITKQP